jgi:hypothetical protein
MFSRVEQLKFRVKIRSHTWFSIRFDSWIYELPIVQESIGGACGENEGRHGLSGLKDQKSSEGFDREAVKRQARRTRNPTHVVQQRPFRKAQTLEEGNMHVCIHEARGPRASTRLWASIKGWWNIDAVLD